jgi:4-hydroxy-2-oxoheptanedioate aldolase
MRDAHFVSEVLMEKRLPGTWRRLGGALGIALVSVAVIGRTPSAQAPTGATAKVRLNRMIEQLASGQPAISDRHWKFLDWEHGNFELDRLEATLGELAKKKTSSGQIEHTPIVRIPMDGDEPFRFIVKQVLEMGAFGIIYPNIETKEQALRAVRAMRGAPQKGDKYPEPAGQRHCCPRTAAKYWGLSLDEYLARADVWPLNPDGELIAMIMIESPLGYKNIDEILSVPGIGAIFLGPADMGRRLGNGYAPSPGTEQVTQGILKACLAKKVVCGIPAGGGPAVLEKRIGEGFKILLAGGG